MYAFKYILWLFFLQNLSDPYCQSISQKTEHKILVKCIEAHLLFPLELLFGVFQFIIIIENLKTKILYCCPNTFSSTS